MFIHKCYLPPTGSKYVSMMDIERLAEVDDMSIAMCGFNWVDTPAMQRLLERDQEAENINDSGEKSLNRHD